MKKAKIMLCVIIVLAIAGAAAAFKAKALSQAFCTTVTVGFVKNGQGVGSCPASCPACKTTIPPFGRVYYYTITANPTQCFQIALGMGAPCRSSAAFTDQ